MRFLTFPAAFIAWAYLRLLNQGFLQRFGTKNTIRHLYVHAATFGALTIASMYEFAVSCSDGSVNAVDLFSFLCSVHFGLSCLVALWYVKQQLSNRL